jgi:hypothetical protein
VINRFNSEDYYDDDDGGKTSIIVINSDIYIYMSNMTKGRALSGKVINC